VWRGSPAGKQISSYDSGHGHIILLGSIIRHCRPELYLVMIYNGLIVVKNDIDKPGPTLTSSQTADDDFPS